MHIIDVRSTRAKEIARLKKENDKLKELLKVAKCPNCAGDGVVPVTTGETWERGDGEVFVVTEPSQCQWCYEVKQALKE